ncbi:MAG: DUF2207 domain-containing protein [Chitinophagaceae bacterium]|nr:DUF2207 domain-containing protein [Chitinophagaceae bacterium]
MAYSFTDRIVACLLASCCFSLPSGLAQPADTAKHTLFSVWSRPQVEAMVRQRLTNYLNSIALHQEVKQARLATFVPALADSINSLLAYHADMAKLYRGDEAFLKKLQTLAGKKLLEKAINDLTDKLLETNAAWQKVKAIDYSDRILSFHSKVQVLPTGKVRVHEFIMVYNGDGRHSPYIDYNNNPEPNNDIRRGIVREFPTRYTAKDGFWDFSAFDLLAVKVNREGAGYHTESLQNGVRLLIGDANTELREGIYLYEILYETDRQLIFHSQKDELYWNVNGNGWVFSADSVSCTISFPAGCRIFEQACYTGYQGSTEPACRATLINDSTIHFSTLRQLQPWEGLTVAAAVQKGILQPGEPRTWQYILKTHLGIQILGYLLAAMLLYYFLAWYFRGRDPKKGVIIPQFEPPAGILAADAGYIAGQKYEARHFAAALVDLAVKKLVKIEVVEQKFIVKWTDYRFVKPAGVNMGSVKRAKETYGFDLENLYGETAARGKYNATLRSAYLQLESKLEQRFRIRKGQQNTWHGLFVKNDGYSFLGIMLLIASVFTGLIYGINYYTPAIALICGVLVALSLITHLIFVHIMSAYTPKGRAIADHIEGFKMYLETAEQQLFEYFTPPEKTLELFEKYLPYAIALGVENSWAEKFEAQMEKAIAEGYSPGYYSTNMRMGISLNMNSISRSISSGLSGSVASATTPPSSSSGGSSGGGSSGGGGGGGGGGGW